MCLGFLGVGVLGVRAAHAADAPHEPVHVVQHGETISRIAQTYKVTEDAIRTLNGIRKRDGLRTGQKISIPAPDQQPERPSAAPVRSPADGAKGPASTQGAGARALAGHKKGVVRLVRGTETVQLTLLDRRRRLNTAELSRLSAMLRYPSGETHKIDPRLASIMALVSDEFGGRDLIIVSGFRPYSSGQYTPHSNHNIGRAFDFIVRGVSNERVRDFCRTLHNVGVGYYPNSSFIHLDVRGGGAYWIDYAGPGQRPRYKGAEARGEADEGAGEVPLDVFHQARLAPGDLVSNREAQRDTGPSTTPLGAEPGLRGARSAPGLDSTGEPSVFPGQR